MAQSIQDILRQISKAEKKQDAVQLVELYRKAATYYFKNGDKAKNAEYLQKQKDAQYKTLKPKTPQYNLSIEEEIKRLTAMPKGVEKLDAAIKFAQNHKKVQEAWLIAGSLAKSLEKWDVAKEALTNALENDLSPELKSELYFDLAFVLQEDHFKEYEKAKFYYEKALQYDPEDESTYYNLALLLEVDLQQYDQAKFYYEKAIQCNPNGVEYYVDLAKLLIQDHFKQYKKARTYLKKALELAPEEAPIHTVFASLHQSYLNEPDKAMKHYVESIKLDDQNTFALQNLAILLLNEPYKEIDRPGKLFEKALSIEPDNVSLLINFLSFLCIYLKDYDRASLLIKKIIPMIPNSYTENHTLALLLSSEGSSIPEESIPFFEKAIELNPSPKLYLTYAIIASERLEDNEKAKQVYEQGIDAFPEELILKTSYELFLKNRSL